MIAQGKIVGSAALNGKMLDLGLLKISLGGVFVGGSNPVGHCPNPVPNPAGQS